MALPLVSGFCHLGAAPVIARGEGGTFRATFSAAFNHKYKDGNRDVQETCWLQCVAWQNLALQIQAARLDKGAWIFVSGRLKERRRPVGEILGVGAGDLDDHGRKEISQHELTVYEMHLPLPRLPGATGRRGEGETGGRGDPTGGPG